MEIAPPPSSYHLPPSVQTPKDVPPSPPPPHLSHQASTTTKATGTMTPVSPDDIQVQRMIFIKQFQETIQRSKHIPFDATHQEAINKYLCDSQPSAKLLNDQQSDSASTVSNLHQQQPYQQIYHQQATPIALRKPPNPDLNSPKKRQSKKLSRKKSNPHSLLKESFKNKRSHEGPLTPPANSNCKDYGYSYNRKELRDETSSQSDLSSIALEDCDSDYWEEDRLLLKWEAKRLGLSYLGMEELAKHTESLKLTEEQRFHLLMK
jgi:hypothetical protein